MTLPKKQRGAIVGFGFIASQGHYPAYLERQDVEIVAIADICKPRQELVLSLNPSLRVYESVCQLLDQERELDFIDIATPPSDHFSIAKEALERGLHVLCEKPLTTSIEQAQELLVLAQRHERVVFPCHNYKHAPVVKTVDKILSSKEIGVVHGLTLNTYRTTHAKGVSEWRPDWRRDQKYSGGGIAMDHGSHTFYLTFHWLKSFPIAVTAKMLRSSQCWDTEDNFSCVLTFPHSYAVAHLTWTSGVRKIIYTLQGSQGAITVENDAIEVVSPRGVRKFDVASSWGDASHVQWFHSLFDQFQQCIARNDFVNSELKDAYQCIQLIQRAYESAHQGCRELELNRFC